MAADIMHALTHCTASHESVFAAPLLSVSVYLRVCEFAPPPTHTHTCHRCALPFEYQNTTEHKRSIIAGYYAMIAEYDGELWCVCVCVCVCCIFCRNDVFVLSRMELQRQMNPRKLCHPQLIRLSLNLSLSLSLSLIRV